MILKEFKMIVENQRCFFYCIQDGFKVSRECLKYPCCYLSIQDVLNESMFLRNYDVLIKQVTRLFFKNIFEGSGTFLKRYLRYLSSWYLAQLPLPVHLLDGVEALRLVVVAQHHLLLKQGFFVLFFKKKRKIVLIIEPKIEKISTHFALL